MAGLASMCRACSASSMIHQARRASSVVSPGAQTAAITASGSPSSSSCSRLSSRIWPMRVQRLR